MTQVTECTVPGSHNAVLVGESGAYGDGGGGDGNRIGMVDDERGCGCARCGTWHDEPNRVDWCMVCEQNVCVYRCSDVCGDCGIVTCRECPCECNAYLPRESPRLGLTDSDVSGDDRCMNPKPDDGGPDDYSISTDS